MTIIIVDNSLDVTGAFRAVNNIVRENPGNEYIFYVPRKSRLREGLEAAGIRVYTFPSVEIRRNIVDLLLYVPVLLRNGFALARLVRRHRAGWIYQNEIFILSGLVARMFTRVKVLTHVRVMPDIFPRSLFRAWLWLHDTFAARLMTVSFVCRDAALTVYPVKQELAVLYDFVVPEEKLPSFGAIPGNGPLRLLFVGNYTRGKGQDIALDALARFRSDYPGLPVSLDCYGGDFGFAPNLQYKAGLEAQIRRLGLEDAVRLHGFTNDVERTIKAHDVLLNLSVAESFSFVVAEGLSYGIPVIATRSGGPGELIEHTVSGWLCDTDPGQVATAIHTLAADDNLRRNIGKAGHQRIRMLTKTYGGKIAFTRMFHEA